MKRILFIIFCLFAGLNLYSQNIGLMEIKTAKVDNLTDKQIRDFVDKSTKEGYTLDQLEEQALQSGISTEEWGKLKARIQNLSASEKNQEYISAKSLSKSAEQQVATFSVETNDGTKIFGSSLFNTANLTFEPNLRLPTPENYQLGPDDELVIDVIGLNEINYRATISPEGIIRLPTVGLIHVNGLTFSQAKKLITSKLASTMEAINTDASFVSVTLGNIRSIKIIVVGEAYRPGTYTLPSVSSVFNTLNACGGPNRNGSFRDIKVIRNNKTIAVVDIYDFLLTGEMQNNIQLHDQDVLKIEPYKKRIELKGAVKNTGYFEAKNAETLQNMMDYSGGFSTNSYKDRISVFRNTEKEKKVADVAFNDFGSFVVEDGDVFKIDTLLDRFENRVQISGAVFRPGTYALSADLTLKRLIEKADGLREDAFLHRGTIIREKDNRETEMLSFNVDDVISGKSDISLKKEDIVTIASAIEMQEVRNVSVFGEVKTPGDYRYRDNMTLQDIIFAAGGTKDAAELRNVEIYRMELDPATLKAGEKIATRHTFTIDKTLNGLDFKLAPHDHVIIRPVSGYTDIKKVMIEGEVYFPGNYILTSNKERISDVIKKAGGLNSFAYPEGAFMIRHLNASIAEEKIEQEVIENISDELIDEQQFKKNESVIGINLEKIIAAPGSKYDLFLEDGDIIRIPKELQTVQVLGNVLRPSFVRFDEGESFKYYINHSGGFSSNSLKRKSYVVYANGDTKATRRVLFFRKYPEVTPGAKIYVPEKPERTNKMSVGEIIGVSSSLITMTALIMSLLK